WSYVGRETFELGGAARPCVWMHPSGQGGVLRVELPAVAAHTLWLGAGFTLYGAAHAARPARLRVLAGEAVLFETVRPPTTAWQTLPIELPAAAPLALEVSSEDNGAAHLCV